MWTWEPVDRVIVVKIEGPSPDKWPDLTRDCEAWDKAKAECDGCSFSQIALVAQQIKDGK